MVSGSRIRRNDCNKKSKKKKKEKKSNNWNKWEENNWKKVEKAKGINNKKEKEEWNKKKKTGQTLTTHKQVNESKIRKERKKQKVKWITKGRGDEWHGQILNEKWMD